MHIETWLEQLKALIARGADHHPEVIRHIRSAPTLEHLDRLDKFFRDHNWYGRLGQEIRNVVMARRAALLASHQENDQDDSPSP